MTSISQVGNISYSRYLILLLNCHFLSYLERKYNFFNLCLIYFYKMLLSRTIYREDVCCIRKRYRLKNNNLNTDTRIKRKQVCLFLIYNMSNFITQRFIRRVQSNATHRTFKITLSHYL